LVAGEECDRLDLVGGRGSTGDLSFISRRLVQGVGGRVVKNGSRLNRVAGEVVVERALGFLLTLVAGEECDRLDLVGGRGSTGDLSFISRRLVQGVGGRVVKNGSCLNRVAGEVVVYLPLALPISLVAGEECDRLDLVGGRGS